MVHDDDERHSPLRLVRVDDPPLTVVPVGADKATAIRAFNTSYPNLDWVATLAELRRDFPGLTTDEVRTVMAGHS
ncbi:hypothetical protein [Actinoplanes rectilineatus]|uniref:hypothetical protein n=1 Tax=Actinoplanes rectilineatus TaxID=113571 RepID=UPI0005F2ED61|nr:hypothetical protein [Actinoplanes rectilineatus]